MAGIGGARARSAAKPRGIPSPKGLRLSPAGGEPHGRWGGGGQETGESATDSGIGACVGNARSVRPASYSGVVPRLPATR